MNTAATLGSTSITQAQAQAKVDEVLAERAKVDTSQMKLETGEALNRSQLRFLVVTRIFDAIAKELKISVSTTEIATTKSTLVQQSGGEEALAQNLVSAAIAPSNFDTYVKAIITSEKLSQAIKDSGVAEADVSAKISQLVIAKAKQLKVSVNPRYGIWDAEQGDIVAKDAADSAVVPAK
jgi:FKBP-type peptidyl-prolyl cis-trans isomerase (trigger factor)